MITKPNVYLPKALLKINANQEIKYAPILILIIIKIIALRLLLHLRKNASIQILTAKRAKKLAWN